MLELSDEQGGCLGRLGQRGAQATLPEEMADFFDQHGTLTSRPGCRRAYLRFYVRSKAILQRQDVSWAFTPPMLRGKGCAFSRPSSCFPRTLPHSVAEDERISKSKSFVVAGWRRVLRMRRQFVSARCLRLRTRMQPHLRAASRRSPEMELHRCPSFAIS